MDNATPFQPWAADDAKNVKSEKELADDAKLHRENVNPKHTQTAYYDKESVPSTNIVAGPSGSAGLSTESVRAKESKMDTAKVASMQQIVENTLGQESRQRVAQLLESIEALSGAERLLLYLRLPTGIPPHDPLKQPINPLGSRAELQQTVTWIQTHLEVDPDVSLPKQDVYDEYIAHCLSSNMKALSTADFGKVMKQVYPSVRPRRLGTRGNSRYCYAGLRKKIKLEVPQLPDLGESSKEPSSTIRESERIVCEWAESKLGLKFSSLAELSRHVTRASVTNVTSPASASSPPHHHHQHQHHGETPDRQLLKQLKRKIQKQGTPGRPKKNKAQEAAGESPPSTSYLPHQPPPLPAHPHPSHTSVKHESEPTPTPSDSYAYPGVPYVAVYDTRATYATPYAAPHAPPPRAHPAPPLPPGHEYRADPYAFEPSYAARDLTLPSDAARDLSLPPDAAHNLPINLSSDASLDLSTERSDWQRRRPPEPPPPPPAPPRLPLPGKKLILETYQSETQGGAASPRVAPPAPQPTSAPTGPDDFPRTEYLPKKMRAAEIMGGKLAAARHSYATESPSTSAAPAADPPVRTEAAFLEDPKNLPNRSKSTAAALAREQREAASGTRPADAAHRAERARARRTVRRARVTSTEPDCCGLDGISIKTGMICEERHSEILNRERVISICNIDKHDLDDYLNEGNSQEHEEELLKYFHQEGREADVEPEPETDLAPPSSSSSTAVSVPVSAPAPAQDAVAFLEAGQDPHDDHSQGKNEKLSQLRELLAKNLKNQSGSSHQNLTGGPDPLIPLENNHQIISKSGLNEGAFKPVAPNLVDIVNGQLLPNQSDTFEGHPMNEQNGTQAYGKQNNAGAIAANIGGAHMYNGNCRTEPQSPTTRTQQYDFVPISEGCHSPGNFNSKSPLGFVQRGLSPNKMNKQSMISGSLQTSPLPHSTAASPFVSPRNTPVPRSRLCPRPIPKHNGRKKRNLLSIGVSDPHSKPFVIPNEQKYVPKTSMCGPNIKYCQPMSAPPSPNIISSHYKNQIFQCSPGVPNGSTNMCLNFLPSTQFRENINGELAHPLSADPLSSEVSQFFQESLQYRPGQDNSFRSQSVPLKQAINNIGLMSYTNTPVGSVPPTPVPHEFCDFGSLADTCDISRAGLNPETLDKIYDAIDSSNDVLNTGGPQNILSSNDDLTNGCDPQPMLSDDQLNTYIPSGNDILDRNNHYNQSFTGENAGADNVEDFLKRTDSIELDLSDLVTEKNKYYSNSSRSVPSTPLPYKRTASNLQIDSRRSRELFVTNTYPIVSNGISSKSVPSTPQLVEDRSVFSYSNRDFLINGNSVEVGGSGRAAPLSSPLHEILHEEMMDPLTPAADLLADLDKMDAAPYVDL